MNADEFLLASGLIGEVDVPDAALDQLAEFAYEFLLSGGTITLAEYKGLSDVSQVALLTGARRVRREQAQEHAGALMDAIVEIARELGNDGADRAASRLLDKIAGSTP